MQLCNDFEPIFHVTKLISAFHVMIHNIYVTCLFFYFRYVPVSTLYTFVVEKISSIYWMLQPEEYQDSYLKMSF